MGERGGALGSWGRAFPPARPFARTLRGGHGRQVERWALPASDASVRAVDPGLVIHPPTGLGPSAVSEFLAAAGPVVDRTSPDGVLRCVGARCDVGPPEAAGARPGVLRRRSGLPSTGPSDLLGRGGLRPFPPSPRRRVERPVLVLELRTRSADNYFHWHVDALVNLWLHRRAVDRAGADPAPPLILAPVGAHGWQQESLRLAGLAEPDLLPMSGGSIAAPEFRVPARSFGSRHVPSWVVRALREVAGGDGGALGVGGSARRGTGRLLNVRRDGTARRRVHGEDEISRRLATLGFVDLHPSTLGVAEQRRRFAEADVIVAAHGAALTNLAWAHEGAVVIELLSLARPNLAFREIATQAGVRHVGVLCRPLQEGDQHADLVADPDLVLPIVEAELPQ